MKHMNKLLTKAEEQVMQVLWKLEKSFLKDIVDSMPEPKPHSNTVATILKILVEKEFVGIEVFGRIHSYYPLISKEEYSGQSVRQLVQGYFDGSVNNVLSFLVKEKELDIKDLELLLQQLKNKKP